MRSTAKSSVDWFVVTRFIGILTENVFQNTLSDQPHECGHYEQEHHGILGDLGSVLPGVRADLDLDRTKHFGQLALFVTDEQNVVQDDGPFLRGGVKNQPSSTEQHELEDIVDFFVDAQVRAGYRLRSLSMPW